MDEEGRMMENTNHQAMQSQYASQGISIPCISLCFLIFVILGFLPMVPDRIVKLVKPAFLILCVLFSGYGYYRFSFEKWLVLLLSYLLLIWVANLQKDPSISSYLSMLLFALFYLFAGLRIWTKAEIRMILKVVILACSIYSLITLYSNNGLLHASGNQHISFLSKTLNRNSCAFAVTPGAIASVFLFFFGEKKLGARILWSSAFLICFFTVVALSCRSAFLSAVAGCFLIAWQATSENADKGRRVARRLFFVVFVFVALLIGMTLLEGTNSGRLFDYSDSGRGDLWKVAWDLIYAKPVFGGGFGYWERSGQVMSTHNAFLNIMLISGFVGGGILAIFMLSAVYECLQMRNLVALAFAMEMIFHSISEAGMDYYAYLPLMLTAILLRYAEYQSKDLSGIFRKPTGYVRA